MNAGVLLRELWQSWRASLRRPGFVLLAGLTLALGVGFATPLLAVVLALRAPLPLPQSDRVVAVELLFNGFGGAVNRSEYKLLSDFHDVYQSVGVSAFPQQVNVSAGQVPQLASLRRVDRQYLFALQPRLLFGRYFSLGEDRPGGARAVIVSHRYWLSRLAGRRDVIGQPIDINGVQTPIVGVLAHALAVMAGKPPALVLPLRLHPGSPYAHSLIAVARLAPGISLQQASVETTTRVVAWAKQSGPHSRYHITTLVMPLQQAMVYGVGKIEVMALIVVGLLVLLTLSNLINLITLRAQQAKYPLSVRAALGASAFRLLMPAIAEGLLIVLVGAAAAALVSLVLHPALLSLLAANGIHADFNTPALGTEAMQWIIASVLGLFTVTLALLMSLRRLRLGASAQQTMQSTHGTMDPGASRLSRGFVIVQSVLATGLVGLALTIGIASHAAAARYPGYDDRDVYAFHLLPPHALYPQHGDLMQLSRNVLAALRGIHGVREAGIASLPWFSFEEMDGIRRPDGRFDQVDMYPVDGGYLRSLRIPVLGGRVFTHAEIESRAPVAMVNEAFVKRYLKGNAVGQSLTIQALDTGTQALRIVGVLHDTHNYSQHGKPLMFLPYSDPAAVRTFRSGMNFVLRMQRGVPLDTREMKARLRAVAPNLAVSDLQAFDQNAPEFQKLESMVARLTAWTGALALTIAALGLYAVMRTAVSARTREFGIRAAMGASPRKLLALVFLSGLCWIGTGLLIGTGLALLLTRSARTLVLGAGWLNLHALLLTWLALLVMGILATLGPALRAARTSPTVSLNESAG
ncbi:MAG: ABC transporter permease [Metallibacterium scheffleri]